MSQRKNRPVAASSRRVLLVLTLFWSGIAGVACGPDDERTTPVRPEQTSAPPRPTPVVWMSNRDTNSAVAFHANTGERLWTVPVEQQPNSVTSPRGTGKAYVTNEASNTVSVISKGVVTTTISIPTPDAKPHHMISSPDGKFVYVAEFGSNKVAVIDTGTDSLVREVVAHPEALPDFPAAKIRTHAVGISADGRTLYAVNTGANTVTALDASTGAIAWGPLTVGKGPSEVAPARDGKKLYVSIRDEDMVQVIDLSVPGSPRLLPNPVSVGDQPDTLELTPDGGLLIVALRGTPARVDLVETRSLSVRSVEIPGATTTGHQSLSGDGQTTFVAIEGARGKDEPEGVPGVAVIDNRTGEVTRHLPSPGGGRPHGVFVGEL
jgi:YVTN family beta-propeller protein